MVGIKKLKETSGFTLVELLVVIAIIGILAAAITPNAFKAVEKAKVSRTESDLKAFKSAALNYYTDTGEWPADEIPGNDPGFMTNVGDVDGWDGPYLERWPDTTPFGGQYDWDKWSDRAGITIARAPNLTEKLMLLIDKDMDDGNLSTGNVVKLDYGFQVILQRW
ncbi:MAG: ral secretion pathway protein [Halanaerobiales bacterium]|nr:ral secretion pathway protein [Halanaerobiales bacterium]